MYANYAFIKKKKEDFSSKAKSSNIHYFVPRIGAVRTHLAFPGYYTIVLKWIISQRIFPDFNFYIGYGSPASD
jgi:hypothetical protein